MKFFELSTYLVSLSAASTTIALKDFTSNDDNRASDPDYCTTNYGGPCGIDRPYKITQDTSLTVDWLKNEPYACTRIWNEDSPYNEWWAAQFTDGE